VEKCVVCGVNLNKPKDYLIVNHVKMSYCQGATCQEHMKETKEQFNEYGIFARMVKA
jgi:hypothetical protein